MSLKTENNSEPQVIHVVDDDISARESLCWLLDTEGYATRAFSCAQTFLDYWNSNKRGCITLDIRMPDITGLQLQEELNKQQNRMPIIMLTGHADVPVAIRAMKLGAYDFLEKPYSDLDLLTSIESALKLELQIDHSEKEKTKAATAMNNLTLREREVMCLVVEGLTNKAAACKLGISEKTVEVHRARVMEKTSAGSLSELVRLCLIFKNNL